MAAEESIIAELEEAIQCGSQEKRVQTLRRITDLFLDGADRFNDAQISVFDDVLGHLIRRIETKAMAELSTRLAPVENAPVEVIRKLARNDEIAVAAPVLVQSARLSVGDLVEIAGAKSQQHLLAISGRVELAEAVTDVLLGRADHAVKHKLAENDGARFSETGFTTLVKSAETDGNLAVKVGSRNDLPVRLLGDLLLKATEEVRSRLLVDAPPESRGDIQRALAGISNEVGHEIALPRDFSRARRTIASMQEQNLLDEAAVSAFAAARRYEEVVAALAALCSAPVELVAPLMKSARIDGLLVACKAAGLQWPTVQAILEGRVVRHSLSEPELEAARADYLRLSQLSAQRTIRFWKVRVGTVRGRSDPLPRSTATA